MSPSSPEAPRQPDPPSARLTVEMLIRQILLFGILCPPWTQGQTGKNILAEARTSSGVWQSTTDIGAVRLDLDMPVAVTIILHTTLTRQTDGTMQRSQSTYLQRQSTLFADTPRYCGERAYDIETRTVTVNGCAALNLKATLSEDGETMHGEIQQNGQPLPIEFHRVETDRSEACPFQGDWTATDRDRQVTFHVSALKSGKIALTQDRTFDPKEPSLISLAEPWFGSVRDDQLRGMAMRSAFNNTDFVATLSDDGEHLEIPRCGARMGLLCPVSLTRQHQPERGR